MANIRPVSSGMRFHPSDDELVGHYLFKKHIEQQVREGEEGLVTECDLYGNAEPWEIFGGGEETIRYYYTILKKKTKNVVWFARTVGNGTWRGVDRGLRVVDHKGLLIGWKRSFVYVNKDSAQHGLWPMKEYSLDEALVKDLKKNNRENFNEYVLCHIKKKDQEIMQIQVEGRVVNTGDDDLEAELFLNDMLIEPGRVNYEGRVEQVVSPINVGTLEAQSSGICTSNVARESSDIMAFGFNGDNIISDFSISPLSGVAMHSSTVALPEYSGAYSLGGNRFQMLEQTCARPLETSTLANGSRPESSLATGGYGNELSLAGSDDFMDLAELNVDDLIDFDELTADKEFNWNYWKTVCLTLDQTSTRVPSTE